MRKITSLIIFLILSACSSVPKNDEVIKVYQNPKLHNADCLIDNQRYSEAGLLLLEETRETYKVKAGDGKALGLPIRQCILSQIETESEFDASEPKQKWVRCTLGNMSLVTDSLIYMNDEKNFYRLKRKDGQIWLLPREHCAIFRFKPEDPVVLE